MHFLCRSFIGPSSSSSWSQYWENEPDNPILIRTKGHLFGLITLSAPDSDLPSLGRQAIESLNNAYFSSDSPSPQTSLKSALTSLLAQPALAALHPQLSLLAVCGPRVHLLAYNSTFIVLTRGRQVSQLLHSSPKTANQLSGPIFSGDRFLLATSQFLDFFTWEKIKNFLSEPKVQTIEELVLPQICIPSSSATLAASLIESAGDDPAALDSASPLPSSPPSPPPVFREKHNPIFISSLNTNQDTRRRKFNLIIGISVILLIAVVSVLGFRRNRQSSINSRYSELKSSLESNIQNALAVKNLDPNSALNFVSQARQILDQMQQLKADPEIETYRQQLSSFSGKLGSTSDFNPDPFYDTSLFFSPPDFNYLFPINNGLGVVSFSQNRVDFVDSQNRSKAGLAAGISLAGFSHFFADQKQIFALSPGAINKFEGGSSSPVFSPASSLGQLVAAQTWNHNLYVLTSVSPYLYKISPNSSGFGSPSTWISSKIDFTPVSLAIDGRIYLLGSDCRVRQFDRGQATDFVSVPISDCQNPRQLSISSQGHFSFLNGSQKLYHLNSQGQIAAVYKLQDKNYISAAIFADQIYFLASDQKIYRLPL